jgi:branched-chain amino acid transport system permease protein
MKNYTKPILAAGLWAMIAWLFLSGRADGYWLVALILWGGGATFAFYGGERAREYGFWVVLGTLSVGAWWLFFQDRRMDSDWILCIHLLLGAMGLVRLFGRAAPAWNAPFLLAVLLFCLVWLSYQESINVYFQSVLMFTGINIIMATSLNLVNGYMGEFNCGHAGPMAVGAYVSSLMTVALFGKSQVFGDPSLSPALALFGFPFCLLVGMAAAAFIGFLISIPSFKTRGDYLAIITIAVSYIIKSTIENMNVIGGARGFMGMGQVTQAMDKAPQVFGLKTSWDLPWMMIWVFLGTVFSVWLLRRFVTSTYGKGIIAICQDEIAAEIMSVNTNRMKIAAFMLSSGLAGLAGGLLAHAIGYVNPSTFNILKSTEALLMVYLGGMGSLSGSVIAAVLFTVLVDALRFIIPILNSALHWAHLIPSSYEVSQVWKWVLIPLLLVVIMRWRPEGLMGNRELTDYFPGLRDYFRFK